jgi:signal transduction histidine kinase
MQRHFHRGPLMQLPWSLRRRLLVGAALWTIGLFGLGIVTWHVTLGNRHPPGVMRLIFAHAHLVAVVCLGCLAAGLLQVRRGWSPINQLRARLARLNDGGERRLDGEYPSEVAPLVGDLNALLDQRDASVAQARATAGDLAHGLKTPLAVLLSEADRAEAAGQADLARAVREQVDRMRRQVDYQLAQARAGALRRGRAGATADVEASAQALARTLRRLHAERGVAIGVDVAPDLRVRIDRADLDEMLGNLLDNACKWARTRAAVSARRDADRIVVEIDDDGPGIAPALREAVFARGVRADEAAPGSGLGLAIVRDLAHACGGAVALGEAPSGGLRVRLTLPAA